MLLHSLAQHHLLRLQVINPLPLPQMAVLLRRVYRAPRVRPRLVPRLTQMTLMPTLLTGMIHIHFNSDGQFSRLFS